MTAETRMNKRLSPVALVSPVIFKKMRYIIGSERSDLFLREVLIFIYL